MLNISLFYHRGKTSTDVTKQCLWFLLDKANQIGCVLNFYFLSFSNLQYFFCQNIFQEIRSQYLEFFPLWSENQSVSCSVVSNSSWSHGLQPARLLCPWDSPVKNTGMGCHFLLQEISLSIQPLLNYNERVVHSHPSAMFEWELQCTH